MLQKLHSFHITKLGLLTFIVIELAIGYGFASLSIDTGSLWAYFITLVLLLGVIMNFVRLIKLFVTASKATA
jgi:hypothetical protein